MRWLSIYSTEWQRKFAWLPVQLDDASVVWLESYERCYVKDRFKVIAMFGDNTRAVGYWISRKGLPKGARPNAQVDRPSHQ